jgi:hypothetical protein
LGLRVSGRLRLEAEKPVPVRLMALIVTGALPLEVRVTDWVDLVLTLTLPKLRLAVLGLSAALAVPSCRAKVCDVPLALAVRVAVWAEVTAATVAEKLALVEPAATVTDPGTVTALSLLDKPTA